MNTQDLFRELVSFDSLPDKAERYADLLRLVESYQLNTKLSSQTERAIFNYILAERCYNQGYEMSYSKAYESSNYPNLFFKKAFYLVAEVLPKTDKRYIKYKELAEQS